MYVFIYWFVIDYLLTDFSIYLLIYLLIYLFTHLFIYIKYLYQFVYLLSDLFIYLFILLFICSFIYIFLYLFHLFIYSYNYLFICLFVYLCIFLITDKLMFYPCLQWVKPNLCVNEYQLWSPRSRPFKNKVELIPATSWLMTSININTSWVLRNFSGDSLNLFRNWILLKVVKVSFEVNMK